MSTSLQTNTSNYTYRSIGPQDQEIIQKLHEDFFPVRYSQQFYQDIVQGIGIFSGKLYSVIVENENHEVIAFVLAQLLDYPSQCEDHDLFNPTDTVSNVFYILTIGCLPAYRKKGIATTLIQMCIEYAKTTLTCGAVYLHVIDYNHSAVRLYEKNSFQYLKTNKDFYLINNQYYHAHVYIFYLQKYQLPFYHQIYHRLSRTAESGWSLVSSAISYWFNNQLWSFLRYLNPLTAPLSITQTRREDFQERSNDATLETRRKEVLSNSYGEDEDNSKC